MRSSDDVALSWNIKQNSADGISIERNEEDAKHLQKKSKKQTNGHSASNMK